MSKLAFGHAARDTIVAGINLLDRAVGCTLGPGGRIVLIEDSFGRVIATKDGVTVARATHVTDQHLQLGILLIQEAALKVAEELGDGTTTCVVVAAELIRQAHRLVGSGADPVQLAAEIRAAERVARNVIMQHSHPVDGDHRFAALLAHVSGNGDERVTKVVSDAFGWVGVSGVMLLREAVGQGITLSRQDGFHIPKGWPQPALAPESGTITLERGAFVLICNRTLFHGDDLMPCLQHAAERGAGIVIVCEQIVGDALETIVGNCRTDALQAVVVRPPGFDSRLFDFMHDLAMWCGATVQDLYTGMQGEILPDLMGYVGRVEQTRDSTTLFVPAETSMANIQDRLAALEVQRASGNAYDRDKAIERIGRLRGRVAVIEAGAPTPAEALEVKYRIEDALCAVRAAYRDGIQPGGGTALYRASRQLPDTPGGRCLAAAMRAPARRIATNAGTDPMHVEGATSNEHWHLGCDAYGLECSMLSLPDPTAVVIGALRSAVSSATTLLTAETAVMLSAQE